MRVMLLAPSWFDFYVAELATTLAQRHEVLVVVDQHWAPWAQTVGIQMPCECTCVNWYPTRRMPLRNLRSLVAMRRVVRRWQPDVIHVQEAEKRFFFGWPLMRHVPVVFDFHNVVPLPGMGHPVLDGFHRLVARHVSGIVVHGQAMKVAAVRRYGVAAEKVAVLPFGRFRAFGGAGIGSRPRTTGCPNILFFGRIASYKGLNVLIRAEPLIAREFGTGFTITVVGEGNLDRVAPGVFRNPRYRIVNERVGAVAPYFEDADIVVLPYLEASTSGVTPVAYAFEKPVIVTDAGSLPESVDDGRTGLVARRGDPVDLAQKICVLLRDDNLRRKMGRQGRQKLDGDLAWTRNIIEVEHCYERVATRF